MSGEVLNSILLFVVMIAVFWFLFINPQRKEMQKRNAMLNAIKVGDKIETISRVIAEVIDIEDHYLLINVAATGMCKIRIDREGVARIIRPEDEAKAKAAAEAAKDKKSDKDEDKDNKDFPIQLWSCSRWLGPARSRVTCMGKPYKY